MFPLDIFFIASMIGTAAFALSGLIAGVRHDLDVMGVFIVAFLTSNGGGIIRDVLVGKTPSILIDIFAISTVMVVFFFGFLLNRINYMDFERRRVFVISDSIGLVAFSLTGTLVGLDADLSIFGVCMLSFITAAGGGILRDLLVNEVPTILRSDFYGSVAILVALIVYALNYFGYYGDEAVAGIFLFALFLRLFAYYKGWSLPRLKL